MLVCRLFISHVQLLSILWSLNIQFALGLDLAFRWLLCNVDLTLGLHAVSKYICVGICRSVYQLFLYVNVNLHVAYRIQVE